MPGILQRPDSDWSVRSRGLPVVQRTEKAGFWCAGMCEGTVPVEMLEMPARAKINITLDVLGLRPDGFHEVEMIMQSVDLHDTVRVSCRQDSRIVLRSDDPRVPRGEDNLMVRAAQRLRQEAGVPWGAFLELDKNIPLEAGLAGGSTDAAAVLMLLNRLWGLHWPLDRLMELGADLGSDVPFCLLGGTALASGRGERVEPLPPLTGLQILLVKPPFGVSTAEIYTAFDSLSGQGSIRASRRLMKSGLAKGLLDLFHNDLQEVTVRLYPEVGRLIGRMTSLGGHGVMTGSGPTVMGLFAQPADLQRAREVFALEYPETFVVRTI